MNAPTATALRFYVLFVNGTSKRAEVLSRAGYATAGEGRRAWSVCSHGAVLVRADGSPVDERTGTSKGAKLMLLRCAKELARELAASPLPVVEAPAAVEASPAKLPDAECAPGPTGVYAVTAPGDAEAPLVLTRQPEAEPALAKTSKRLRPRAPVAPVETVIELPAAPAPAAAVVEAPVDAPLEPLVPACEHAWAHAGLGAACVLCGERVRYGEPRWPAVEASLREAAALERAAAPVVTPEPEVTSAPAEPVTAAAETAVTPAHTCAWKILGVGAECGVCGDFVRDPDPRWPEIRDALYRTEPAAAEPPVAPETPADEEPAEDVARVLEQERHEAFAESQRELAALDTEEPAAEGPPEVVAPAPVAVRPRAPGVAKARPAKASRVVVSADDPAAELDAALSLVTRQARVIAQLGGLEAAEQIAAGVAAARRAGSAR